MTSLEKKTEVMKYYSHIEKYFPYDIKNLEGINTSNEYGYCGTPQVLTLFALMEIWGNLFSDDTNPTQERKIEVFFSKFLTELKDWRNVLLRLIRHGISHQFFPKNVAISKHNVISQSKDLFFKNKSGEVVLNVTFLTLKVKEAFVRIKSALDDDNNVDRVYEKIIKIQAEDQKAFNSLKSEFSSLKTHQLIHSSTTVYPEIKKQTT